MGGEPIVATATSYFLLCDDRSHIFPNFIFTMTKRNSFCILSLPVRKLRFSKAEVTQTINEGLRVRHVSSGETLCVFPETSRRREFYLLGNVSPHTLPSVVLLQNRLTGLDQGSPHFGCPREAEGRSMAGRKGRGVESRPEDLS